MAEVAESMARWRARLAATPGGADAAGDVAAARAHVDPEGGTASSGGDD
jgi:hypothetical protein